MVCGFACFIQGRHPRARPGDDAEFLLRGTNYRIDVFGEGCEMMQVVK